MKRIKFPQHNKTDNITAIQANILEGDFFILTVETNQKGRQFQTGIRSDFPMSVFYFLTKFKIQFEKLGIARSNVQ
jgi:hypothetical protein